MGDALYVISKDGGMVRLVPRAYEREADFQQLLADYPDLLAGEQIDPVAPRRWLFIAAEPPIPDSDEGDNRWALDLLFLDQDAIPTLVEVKRKDDTRLRRAVVAQLIEYAANAVVYWPGETLRALFEAGAAERGHNPATTLAAFLGNEDVDAFWQRAYTNLRAGRVRLVFVADRIAPELQRIVEFLNERMTPTEVLALELRRYGGEGMSTHVPRVVGMTSDAQIAKRAASGGARPRRSWDRATFLEDARSRLAGTELAAVEAVLDYSSAEAHIDWGSGADRGSINPKYPGISRRAPITLYSDGMLLVKLGWLNDSPLAVRFSRLCRQEIEAIGIALEQDERKDTAVAVAAWAPLAGAVIDALRTARGRLEDEAGASPTGGAGTPVAPKAEVARRAPE